MATVRISTQLYHDLARLARKKLFRDKHSSLVCLAVGEEEEKVLVDWHGVPKLLFEQHFDKSHFLKYCFNPSHFHPILIFVGKAGASQSGDPLALF